ncbi:MAG: DUF58 domain-containing protein [Gammaproteobacteria bacterium]|nr:DUF58 domain-containing protein [Gammaproteobacteria bacterium]
MPRLPPKLLYRLFPLAGRASFWVERRLTPAGRMVFALGVGALLFGVDMRQTLAYQVAALALAALVAARLAGVGWRPRLTISRVLPDFATRGTSLVYFVEIANHGQRVERDLVLGDSLLTPALDYAAFQRRRAGDGRRRGNIVDRAIGFPRWVALRRHDRGADLGLVEVPAIAPGARLRVPVELTPLRRGALRFEAIELYRPDPLGLYRSRHRVVVADTLLALPRRHPMPAFHLRSERHYQRGGISLAHAVGDSQEFAALRDYRPGDPRRHIHWRSFARTGQLVVKEYQDEYFDRHALVIDTHVASGPLLEGVVEVAASIAAGRRGQDSILDLLFAGREVIELGTGRGLGDEIRALAYLAEVDAGGEATLDDLAALLDERAGQLASVVCVLAGSEPARRALVTRLAALGIAVVSLELTLDDSTQAPRAHGAERHFTIRVGHLGEDLARVSTTA